MWFSRFVIFAVFVAFVTAQNEPGFIESTVKYLGQCGDKELSVCIKERALRAIEAASGDLEITEGITLKKDETAVEPTPVEEPALPEEGRARESAIEDLLVERVANFLTSHSLEFKVPKNTADEVKRSLEEARKKKKGGKKGSKKLQMLLPLLLLLKLKAALILPIILGAIAFIAFKALIVGKIALVLSLVGALKKLLSKGKEHGHDTTYDVIAHPPVHHGPPAWPVEDQFHHESHGHGHYRRSAEAQNLAYNAYSTNPQ